MLMLKIKMKIRRNLWFINKLFYSKFGKNSLIYKPMLIANKKNISIGKNCFIRNFARIEVLKKYGNQKFNPKLIIEDNTSFEQCLHLTCAEEIKIGKNCVFSGAVLITDINHSYEEIDTSVLSQELITKKVEIGDNCFIGFGAKIFPGVTLGDNVIIGAGSLVTSSIPSYSVAVGSPARIVKKYNFENKKWEKYKEEIAI